MEREKEKLEVLNLLFFFLGVKFEFLDFILFWFLKSESELI